MLTSNPGTPPEPQNSGIYKGTCITYNIRLAFMCPWRPKNPLIYSSYRLIVSGLSLHMISWKLKFPQIKTTASYILINESVYLQEENRNNRKWRGPARERERERAVRVPWDVGLHVACLWRWNVTAMETVCQRPCPWWWTHPQQSHPSIPIQVLAHTCAKHTLLHTCRSDKTPQPLQHSATYIWC